jgi:hypothetical protein
LKRKPSDYETKKRCVDVMTKIGTKNYCREILSTLSEEIVKESKKFGPNPYMEKLVDFMSDWKK